MDLESCKRKGFIRRTTPNRELAKSLVEMSKIKEKTVIASKLDKENISAYIPMAYDSLREILEAVGIMNSFKVTSHICMEKLLATIYPKINWEEFDRFRYTRNSINYYGEKVDFEQGRELIDKMFLLKKDILLILEPLI